MTKKFKPATHDRCPNCLRVTTFGEKGCDCHHIRRPGILESGIEAACAKLGIETAAQLDQLKEYEFLFQTEVPLEDRS